MDLNHYIEQLRRYIVDLNHYIEQLRSNLYERDEELARDIQEVIKKQNISGQISQIDTLKQIIAHNYQSASTYSNLIIIAGYAGLFGVWQFTRTYLSKEEALFIALLALISIFIFAGYETYKMVSSAYFTRKFNQIVRSIPETEVITAYRYAWTEHSLQQSRVWRWQIIPTVLTGYGAGFCLIYAFIRELAAGAWKGGGTIMTREHVGIIITILGTICLAFSVKATHQNEWEEDIARDKMSGTRIIRWSFWLGLLCVAVGTGLQW